MCESRTGGPSNGNSVDYGTLHRWGGRFATSPAGTFPAAAARRLRRRCSDAQSVIRHPSIQRCHALPVISWTAGKRPVAAGIQRHAVGRGRRQNPRSSGWIGAATQKLWSMVLQDPGHRLCLWSLRGWGFGPAEAIQSCCEGGLGTMHCPFCRHPDSRVVDSRTTDDGTSIRRRRQCPDCSRRFTTVETASLMVIKSSGVTEPFCAHQSHLRRPQGMPGTARHRRRARQARPAGRRGGARHRQRRADHS